VFKKFGPVAGELLLQDSGFFIRRAFFSTVQQVIFRTPLFLAKVCSVPQKIIIDADPGIGDAFAVLTALVDPSLDVLALTATAGSVSGMQATRNLQYLVDLIDPPKHPRIAQSDLPAIAGRISPGEVPTRHHFFGSHGLGDVVIEVPDLHNRRESAKLIVELVREFPHEVKVLTLGPLTNIAAACELDPEFPELVASVVWSDPEAAAFVFQLPTTKVLVPLEVTGNAVLTFEDVDQLSELTEGTINGDVLSTMLQFSIRANRQELAFEGIPLHSVVALAVAAHAERFTVTAVRADVETSGEITRGMTVIDRRSVFKGQTNVDLVSTIDELGVVDYFSRSFRRAAR
jgi:inosine-uridine nucleoside N-ribohydrolase